MSLDDFRARLRDGVDTFSRRGKTDDATWTDFAGLITDYLAADFTGVETYHTLAEQLAALNNAWRVQADHSIPCRKCNQRLHQQCLSARLG